MGPACEICKRTTEVSHFLENCWHSLPSKSSVIFTCPHCGEESQFTVQEGSMTGKSPLPPIPVPQLKVFLDPTYGIDCVFQGRLYHIPKKKTVPAPIQNPI